MGHYISIQFFPYCPSSSHDVLVANGSLIVCKHVQAPGVKDLVELGGGSLVIWTGNGSLDSWRRWFILEVGLIRGSSSEERSGAEATLSGDAGSPQASARSENRCHCKGEGLN